MDRQELKKTPARDQLHQSGSALDRYRQRAVGDVGWGGLAYYELSQLLLSNLSGALGFQLRKWFSKSLFKECGSGLILGKGVGLRKPGRMILGDRVSIDDYALLDAGPSEEDTLTLGDDLLICRNAIIQSKGGPVTIGPRGIISPSTVLTAANGIHIGADSLIGAHGHFGGGRYNWDNPDVPINNQGMYSKGPVVIGDDVFIGTNCVVIDGVTIGRGAVIGAGSVVASDIPELAIAAGVPARVLGTRGTPRKGSDE